MEISLISNNLLSHRRGDYVENIIRSIGFPNSLIFPETFIFPFFSTNILKDMN